MSVPHISLTLSVTMVPSCVFSWLRPTRWGASKPFSPITRRTRRGLERTPATRDRRRWRSLEKAIHAGARNTPRARDPRQAITTRRGRRDRLAHRIDLLRAKGLLASMAAILADSNSFQSGDFILAIVARALLQG